MERDFKGVWIPKEIWLSKNLSMLEKVLLTEISSLDNEDHCTAGNDYFAEFCNCGVATITRAISHLKELGYIEELPYNGRYRTLRVITLSGQTNQNDYSDSSKRLAINIDNNIDNRNISTNVEIEQATPAPTKTTPRRTLITDTVTPNKKKSRYEQCVDVIDELVEPKAIELKQVLTAYLAMRLAIKDKPMYVSGWKALLRKLFGMSDDTSTLVKIVSQSLENSWATFYPLKNNKYMQNKDVFNEFGKVTAIRSKKENISNVQF